jgi:hypothetical protein
VRALDIAQVAVLEHGVRPGRDVGQRGVQAGPAGHLRALGHGRLDPGRRGQPAGARGRHPAERVVEAQRRGSQVEGRLLDPGPRRQQHRMPGLISPVRVMDDQATDVFKGAPGRPGDMDHRSRAVDQAVQFGRGVVAQRRPGPAAQDSGPQQRRPPRLTAERGVDPGMDPLPGAAVQAARMAPLVTPSRTAWRAVTIPD